jgi:protein ImuB
MARGGEEPLRTRRAPEGLVEGIELGEAISGPQLERVVALLVDRLLANPARRGRSLRRLRLAARLAGGGGWRDEAALRQASTDHERLLLALQAKLGAIPGPVVSLTLRVLELGPAAGDQTTIDSRAADSRRRRLAEAVRQTRAAAGKDAVLRVIDADVDSRVPERRSLLTPYQEADS